MLTLNEKYYNKRTRLRITASLQKETPMETTQTVASVEEDRKLFIQASIVRIMKSRKLLKHNALVQEVRELVAKYQNFLFRFLFFNFNACFLYLRLSASAPLSLRQCL